MDPRKKEPPSLPQDTFDQVTDILADMLIEDLRDNPPITAPPTPIQSEDFP